ASRWWRSGSCVARSRTAADSCSRSTRVPPRRSFPTLATDSPSTRETKWSTSWRRRASATFARSPAPRRSESSCLPSARSSCRSATARARRISVEARRRMAPLLHGESRPARNDARSPHERIRDVEGVRELQDDAGQEAVLVILVQQRQLDAVVLVDHDDAPEGNGILRSGYPVAHDDEVVAHLDVATHHRPPGVAG